MYKIGIKINNIIDQLQQYIIIKVMQRWFLSASQNTLLYCAVFFDHCCTKNRGHRETNRDPAGLRTLRLQVEIFF